MPARDCTAAALVLLCLLAVACEAPGKPEPDLRIQRPSEIQSDVIDVVVEGLELHMGPDFERKDEVLRSANAGQRAIYALDWTTLEVNNGGWHQFFWNSSGALTDEAIAGAELVGARENAGILREAAAVFPRGEVPEDRTERQRLLGSVSETEDVFGPLARRWYAHDVKLERLMVAYIEAHPEQFFR